MSQSFDQRLHGDLIGRQGSRRSLNTPVLILDIEALDHNIAAMAKLAASKGVQLRPHAKTHKSVDIAKRQIAAGAIGQCCAKLGEAETLAEGGIAGLHITSPVVSPSAITRLVVLNESSERLSVVVDNPANVAALARAASAERPLNLFIDIDPGIRRTGVASPEAAVALAEMIKASAALTYGGVQFYCGREQHIESFEERQAAVAERTVYLQNVIAALTQAGSPPIIVTGSGTGTHRIDLELGVFTELQVGSYVFMDDQYRACDLAGLGADASPYETSLYIDARVVSANARSLVTVDAGFKAFATEGEPPQVAQGAPEGARFAFMGDEHGAVIAPDIGSQLIVSDRVILSIPHCDPTVDLYDSYHVVVDDTLVEIWPVSARGRSR